MLNKIIFNKKTIAATVFLALSSSYVVAAPTDGGLNFSFQGVIPPGPQAPTGWSFVTLTGSPYIPGTISLSADKQTDGSYIMNMISPQVFGIKSTSGTFTSNTQIQATLISTSVSGSGLIGSTALTPTVTINGLPLTNTAKVVATPSGSTANLSLTTSLTIPSSSVNVAGGAISIAAAIVFSADV